MRIRIARKTPVLDPRYLDEAKQLHCRQLESFVRQLSAINVTPVFVVAESCGYQCLFNYSEMDVADDTDLTKQWGLQVLKSSEWVDVFPGENQYEAWRKLNRQPRATCSLISLNRC